LGAVSRGKSPRNAPCPCGSGLKYKRCCLEDGTWLESVAVVASLPILFPLLRSSGPAFDAWVERGLAATVTDASGLADLVDEGLSLLGQDEAERILELAPTVSPDLWTHLRNDLGDEQLEDLLHSGAVLAALGEQRTLDPHTLALLDGTNVFDQDPLEPLALTLDADALWSVVEAEAAEAAVAAIPDYLDDEAYERRVESSLAQIVRSYWSDSHAERLQTLVARVRAQLPLAGFPRATRALATACDFFAGEQSGCERLAAMLLFDTLDPFWADELDLAA
jgi:hypothetical protein